MDLIQKERGREKRVSVSEKEQKKDKRKEKWKRGKDGK